MDIAWGGDRNDDKNLPYQSRVEEPCGVPAVIFTHDIGKYATCMREIDVPLLFSTRAEIKDGMSGVWVDL